MLDAAHEQNIALIRLSVFGDRSETVPSMIDRLRQNIVNDFGTLMPKSRAMR